jgi:hypothetical protein
MKKIFIFLLFSLTILACKSENEVLNNSLKPEELNDFACLNANVDKPYFIADIKKHLFTSWTMKNIITMVPSKTVPDVKIVFNTNGTVDVFQDGKKAYQTTYTLKEESGNGVNWVTLSSEANTLTDHPVIKHIIAGTIRTCEKELIIDQGIAFDAPAYLFRKTE